MRADVITAARALELPPVAWSDPDNRQRSPRPLRGLAHALEAGRVANLKRQKPQHWESAALVARSSIYLDDYERLWDLKADVLVSHEAGSAHEYGFSEIDDLARAIGVSKIVHGHHHEDYRAVHRDGLEVVGVGLASAVDERGNLLKVSDRPNKARLRASDD